jgi:hypothetical protein
MTDFIAVQCFDCKARARCAAATRTNTNACKRTHPSARLTLTRARGRLLARGGRTQAYQVQRGGKKVPTKFACKMCGAKQSVRAVFGRSSRAADVRATVQALNARRADTEAAADAAAAARYYGGAAAEPAEEAAAQEAEAEADAQQQPREGGGMWAQFLDGDDAKEGAAAAAAAAAPPRRAAPAPLAYAPPPPCAKRSRCDDDEQQRNASAAALPPPPLRRPYDDDDEGVEGEVDEFEGADDFGDEEAEEAVWRPVAASKAAPLSPQRPHSNARAPPAPAAGGKWAAFAPAADEEDW